jgi:hypothetical protein
VRERYWLITTLLDHRRSPRSPRCLGIDGIRGVLLKAYDKVSRGTAAVPFDSEAPRT